MVKSIKLSFSNRLNIKLTQTLCRKSHPILKMFGNLIFLSADFRSFELLFKTISVRCIKSSYRLEHKRGVVKKTRKVFLHRSIKYSEELVKRVNYFPLPSTRAPVQQMSSTSAASRVAGVGVMEGSIREFLLCLGTDYGVLTIPRAKGN